MDDKTKQASAPTEKCADQKPNEENKTVPKTSPCEFLTKGGNCALSFPHEKEPNIFKVDTRKGICEFNGVPVSGILEMHVTMIGGEDTEVTLKMVSDVEIVADNCSENSVNALRDTLNGQSN